MARSMERLAKAFDEGMHKTGSLTRDDGLAAMQTSASMVCQDCSQCGIYAESEREDSYYLYYLLRAFEQKGQIEKEDMPSFSGRLPQKRGLSGPVKPQSGPCCHESVLEEPFSGKP